MMQNVIYNKLRPGIGNHNSILLLSIPKLLIVFGFTDKLDVFFIIKHPTNPDIYTAEMIRSNAMARKDKLDLGGGENGHNHESQYGEQGRTLRPAIH